MTKSTKRRSESMAGDYTPYSKRARPMAPNVEEDSLMAGIERPRVDARTGLRNAFPGLDDDDGGELFYGPATDGLEYLRMVRSEAKGVPTLLVAPQENAVSEDEEAGRAVHADEKGYYANGAYTAKPGAELVTGAAISRESLKGQSDPQESYRQRLILRFKLLRANLRISPPAKAVAELDNDHPTGVSGNRPVYKRAWKNLLLHTEPLPTQLAVMDTTDVLRLLKIVTGLLRRNVNVATTASRWIWTLLARIEDVGCASQQASPSDADSISVSMIRDSSEEAEERAAAAAEAEAVEFTNAVQEEEGEEEREEEEGEVRDEPFPSPNTLATLDMIITIAGEIFGQRDLLEYQELWG